MISYIKQQPMAFLLETSAFVPSVDIRKHVLFHLLQVSLHSTNQQPIEFLMETSATVPSVNMRNAATSIKPFLIWNKSVAYIIENTT